MPIPTRRAPRRTARSGRKTARLRTVADASGVEARAGQRDLFELVLRSEPNRRGKPYSQRTIGAYLDAVDSLGRWLDGRLRLDANLEEMLLVVDLAVLKGRAAPNRRLRQRIEWRHMHHAERLGGRFAATR